MTLPVTLHLGRSDMCAYAPRTINNGEEKRAQDSLSYITRSEIDLGIGERDSSQIYIPTYLVAASLRIDRFVTTKGGTSCHFTKAQ